MTKKLRRWRVAAVQMTSTEDREANLEAAFRLAREAVRDGAQLVAFPENFSFLRVGSRIPYADDLKGDFVGRLQALSRELRVHLLAGSIPERIPRSRRIHNTSLLLSPRGELLAVYRKIHLFDIRIPGGVSFEESRLVASGDRPVAVDTALGRLGLSICYDLRFPELYRTLALAGAQVLFIPSAFTAFTGKDHWMPLLRARAIENLCWVVAPAQVGVHGPKRASHGHSVVIDPWGTIVAELAEGVGVVSAEIDLDRQAEIRKGLPSLRHARKELLGKARVL